MGGQNGILQKLTMQPQSYLLPVFEVEFLTGACTKYRFQLAVDNQQLGNFQVEEPFPFSSSN